jgi:hypothetical protein
MMEWMSRILVGEMAGADEDFGSEVGQMRLIFSLTSQLLIQLSMIDMDQMILSEASIIIIWTYKDMVEWLSRILVGEMAGADEDFGSEVVQMWLIFLDMPVANPTQHDRHGPDDPFRSINYHHVDISGHDGMDEQDIGWRNGWC